MTFFLLSVFIALAVSALCSLLEAILLSLTPGQVADLTRQHPRIGGIWQQFKTQIDRPIAVILVVNTAAHTIGATLAGAQFETAFGPGGLIWFSILFTYLMLQFTEILPKTLGVQHNRRLAPLIAYPLAWLVRVFRPVLFLIHLVNRPFGRKGTAGKDVSLEEITTLASMARISNLISPDQERIIRGTSDLSEKTAADLMIPAEQVTFISTKQNLMEAILTAHADPHTRFPIIEGDNRNRVLGYVNFKEMIYHARTNPHDSSLLGIIRPVHFVKPEQPANRMLRAFVGRHEHMAIVKGDNDETLGLVTLEDIVEELVGELEDEFDRLPRMFHPLRGGIWMVGGGVPAREVSERLKVDLPDPKGTLSSWLIEKMGRVPKANEVHRLDGCEFVIRRTRRGKVFEASVRVLEQAET